MNSCYTQVITVAIKLSFDCYKALKVGYLVKIKLILEVMDYKIFLLTHTPQHEMFFNLKWNPLVLFFNYPYLSLALGHQCEY